MNYASWSVVFGEQPSAAKWNILGTNDAYFDSLVGSGTAWASWTPTLSGRFTDAKWDKTCKYVQIGKTVHFRMRLVANATSPMAGGETDARFTLPVTAVDYAPTEKSFSIGVGGVYDASPAAIYHVTVLFSSTSLAVIRLVAPSGAFNDHSVFLSNNPITWTTSDEITVTGTYEAA